MHSNSSSWVVDFRLRVRILASMKSILVPARKGDRNGNDLAAQCQQVHDPSGGFFFFFFEMRERSSSKIVFSCGVLGILSPLLIHDSSEL